MRKRRTVQIGLQKCTKNSSLTAFVAFQCVENSVCILRNLSYRLENEVDRERYKDAPVLIHPGKETEKDDPGCMAGCGTGAKKNKKKKGTINETEQPQLRKDPVEGVELLWQPEIAKSYLSIMAESANPETLEGSAGAIHNLTACGWRVCKLCCITNILVPSFAAYFYEPFCI